MEIKKLNKLNNNCLAERLREIMNIINFDHKYIEQCNNPQSTLKEQTDYLVLINNLYKVKNIEINNDDIINNFLDKKINISNIIACFNKKINF
jgi:hypothetical protein